METTPSSAQEPVPQNPVAQRFIRALRQLEASGEVAALLELFSPDIQLSRMNGEDYQGQDEAREFWQEYVAQFGVVRSSFTHITEGANAAVLEWVSEGTLSDQTPLTYRGVSILEIAGDEVKRFRTYYDSAVFTPAGAKAKEGQAAAEPQTAG